MGPLPVEFHKRRAVFREESWHQAADVSRKSTIPRTSLRSTHHPKSGRSLGRQTCSAAVFMRVRRGDPDFRLLRECRQDLSPEEDRSAGCRRDELFAGHCPKVT